MWYYELWCDKSIVCKSELFETKRDAIRDVKKKVDEHIKENKNQGCIYCVDYYRTGEEE